MVIIYAVANDFVFNVPFYLWFTFFFMVLFGMNTFAILISSIVNSG